MPVLRNPRLEGPLQFERRTHLRGPDVTDHLEHRSTIKTTISMSRFDDLPIAPIPVSSTCVPFRDVPVHQCRPAGELLSHPLAYSGVHCVPRLTRS